MRFKTLLVIGLAWVQATMAATLVEIAVSPDAAQRGKDVWSLATTVLMTGNSGDIVTLVDSKGGLRMSTLKITEEMASSPNPNARSTWLMKQQAAEVKKAKTFLDNPSASNGSGDFVRWVRSLELRKTEFPGVDKVEAVHFGSPLVTQPEAYSMVNRYPSDAFLFQSDSNLLSTIGKEKSLQGMNLHVVHSADLKEFSERNRDLHQKKIHRFYGFFIGNLGGNLASFAGTSDHLKAVATTKFPKLDYGVVENRDGKPVVYEILTPQLEKRDASRQNSLWESKIDKNPQSPQRTTAPFDIGISWNQNLDLDLYVMPDGDQELSFQKTSSAKYAGRFVKDITALPGTNGFETITYDGDVPLRLVRVYVNHYAGTSNVLTEVELRIRTGGATFFKKFRLPPGQGTRGAGNRESNPAWFKVDLAQVLGIGSQ